MKRRELMRPLSVSLHCCMTHKAGGWKVCVHTGLWDASVWQEVTKWRRRRLIMLLCSKKDSRIRLKHLRGLMPAHTNRDIQQKQWGKRHLERVRIEEPQQRERMDECVYVCVCYRWHPVSAIIRWGLDWSRFSLPHFIRLSVSFSATRSFYSTRIVA